MPDPSPPGWVPISPNPFIVGNPIRGRAMFFGREAEFELVRRRFQAATRGGLLVFCGERRSGKTSILFQITDGRLGPDFIPVLIDMQSMAITGEIDFLEKVAAEVLAALGEDARVAPPEFQEGSSHVARFQRFVRDVLAAHPHRKLILLFDEYELFENKIDAGALSDDVLHMLSGLMESESVFLIFTGSRSIEERHRDYWRILGKSIYKTISYLDRDDALNLIRKPVEGEVRYGDGVVEGIHRLTAGQPFYTQAVCQSLVDRLNEARTRDADGALLEQVVAGMVENPLPQMIFLWDGLARDEKLVLALLAESLPDPTSFASASTLARALRARGYPLDLDNARMATTLEKLFKDEALLKSGEAHAPGYAFRMDLWRQWVRRMHSVWQVIREEGLPMHGPAGRTRAMRPAVLAGTGIAVLALGAFLLTRPSGPSAPGGATDSLGSRGPAAWLSLQVVPAEAVIYQDGRRIAIGGFGDHITAGAPHEFRLEAPGFADTTLSLQAEPGDSSRLEVALRPLLGAVRIETDPPGAQITLDGRPRGRSPLTVGALAVARPHTVEASMPGRAPARQNITVTEDSTLPLRLTLPVGTAELAVSTEPSGAQVLVAGALRGTSPVRLTGLGPGPVRLGLRRDGHLAIDTTVEVPEGTSSMRFTLATEPPGSLVVQGDRPARIYVNGSLVVENVQNSGPVKLAGGTHEIQIVLVSGEQIDTSVVVRSGERVTFDYSKRTVRRAGD